MINTLEAILFSSPRPLTLKELGKMLGVEEEKVEELVESLNKRYEGTALVIKRYGDAFRLEVREEYLDILKKFHLIPEFTKGELKGIALILQKGEVSLSDIKKVYKNAGELIKKLRSYGFVVIRKEGRKTLVRKTKIMDSYFKG